jgi:hypothetical protein
MDRIKGPWSPEEDEALRKVIEKHGLGNWSLISRSIPGRSGKSCRLRWRNQLSPQNILRRYEVFLSFRGEDTRASFTSHLYASLQNNGIIVFKDDDSLQRGDHISTSLLRAIEQSQIAVIIFSRNYADSRWCLDELVKIMACHRTIGQIVLPVFYDVDPSEVRHQTGEFGNAFQNVLTRASMEEDASLKWRDALREAAALAGFVVLNSR